MGLVKTRRLAAMQKQQRAKFGKGKPFVPKARPLHFGNLFSCRSFGVPRDALFSRQIRIGARCLTLRASLVGRVSRGTDPCDTVDVIRSE